MSAHRERSAGRQSVLHPANCVCFGLRKATRAVTRLYDEALKPCDLKATQFSLLSQLAAEGMLPFAELMARLNLDQTTLTRNLRPLERRALVRVRPGQDRRTREISLTSRGAALHARALPLWEDVQARVSSRLGRARWRQMQRELDLLAAELSD